MTRLKLSAERLYNYIVVRPPAVANLKLNDLVPEKVTMSASETDEYLLDAHKCVVRSFDGTLSHFSKEPSLLHAVNHKARRNVVKLGIGFLLLFIAYEATQNFATSRDVDSDLGGTSIGINYTVYTFFNLVAPFIVRQCGPRTILVSASLTYVTFIFVNVFFKKSSLYFAAVLVGIGGATLWTAQGTYLARCIFYYEDIYDLPLGSTVGMFSGIFFAFYKFAEVAGNLLMALLFRYDITVPVIFMFLTCIAFLAVLCLATLHHFPARTIRSRYSLEISKSPSPQDCQSVSLHIFRTLGLWNYSILFLLAPITVYSGLSHAFISGDFPPLIKANNSKFYVLAVIGVVNSLFSIIFGYLSDKIGRTPVFFVGLISHTISFVFLLLYEIKQSQLWLFMVIGMFLAIGDAVAWNQSFALFGIIFDNEPEAAFANYKLFQAGAEAASFLYGSRVVITTKLIIVLSVLWFASLLLFISPQLRSASLPRKKKIVKREEWN